MLELRLQARVEARLERMPGVMLLGTASIDLARQASETLAGRADDVEPAPVDLLELSADGVTRPRPAWPL